MQGNNIDTIKLNENLTFMEKIMNIMFIVSGMLGVVINFSGMLSETLNKLFIISSILAGYAGLVIYIFIKSKSSKKFFYLWIVLVVYMLVIGFINTAGWKDQAQISTFLNQDIRYTMYYAIGIAYADKLYIEKYNKFMLFLGMLSILFAFLALFNLNFSIYLISERQGVWTIQYYYWWLSASIFAYLFPYTQITGKHKMIGYGVLAAYGGLGLIFLKRSALINVLFIVLITVFLKPNKKIKKSFIMFISRIIMILMLIVMVLLIFQMFIGKESVIGRLFDALFARFNNVDYFENFNRTTEAREYFMAVDPIYYVLGQGMGKYVFTSIILNALHTGAANLIYKGGIFYLAFYVVIIAKTIKAFINRNKLSKQALVCLCTVSSSLLSLAYEFSWSYTTLIFGYATATAFIFNLDYKKGEEIQ